MAAFMMMSLASCADDFDARHPQVELFDESNLVETRLAFDVAAMRASLEPSSRAIDPDDRPSDSFTAEELRGTDAERAIDNIWVFQFSETGDKLLMKPRYYDLSGSNASPDKTEGHEVKVLLQPEVASKIYVVANTGDSQWGTMERNGWSSPLGVTPEKIKALTLTNPRCITLGVDETTPTSLSLPMEGCTATVTPVQSQSIPVMLTRMYAKVEIMAGQIPPTIQLTDVNVQQIPFYCRVGELPQSSPSVGADYTAAGNHWTSRAFKPGSKDSSGAYQWKMVLYIPENLQGRSVVGESNPELKSDYAPEKGLRIDFIADYIDQFSGDNKESGREYTVYPGCNEYNDYNIRRNCIYRVKFNLHTDRYKENIPSSNCFVVKPGQMLSFLPYFRTEKGGGYDFTDWLDANGTDPAKKINDSAIPTENIKIVWQDKDVIGDNSKGNLVWVDRLSQAKDEFHRKIHVRAGTTPGNALIAAYNSAGEIVWSWHIWVTANEPGNLSSAVVYNTHPWDETGIKYDKWVPGYAIMQCNLGALRNAPATSDKADKTKFDTYGLIYQWGRKDPFPQMKTFNKWGAFYPYDNRIAGINVYDNSHTFIKMTASGGYNGNVSGELFRTELATNVGSTKAEGLKYAVRHPVDYISAATNFEDYKRNDYLENHRYFNRGDWLPESDESLWGAVKRYPGMKKYTPLTVDDGSLWDNYGSEKTIYDPCPAGWRVPPADLWLGFTSNAAIQAFLNKGELNCTEGDDVVYAQNGFTMYMQDWHKGVTSFFPTQGSRTPSGQPMLGGFCGNYHNATTDQSTGVRLGDGTTIDRVNILHMHTDGGGINRIQILETQMVYYLKSTGGPIRCVRDHK